MRFYDPDTGVIRFDGIDIREADPQQLRQRMALVPQDPVIFGADAWENIRYGLPEVNDGERGIRLSGGQGQRSA